MDCKKYRAYLICLVVAVVVCGAIFLTLRGKKSEVPVDGTLVENDTGAVRKAEERKLAPKYAGAVWKTEETTGEAAQKDTGVEGFHVYGEDMLVKNLKETGAGAIRVYEKNVSAEGHGIAEGSMQNEADVWA